MLEGLLQILSEFHHVRLEGLVIGGDNELSVPTPAQDLRRIPQTSRVFHDIKTLQLYIFNAESEMSRGVQLARYGARNAQFQEAINAHVDLLPLTPQLHHLLYQGDGFKNADPFLPALSNAISCPLSLLKLCLYGVMVKSTELLYVLTVLAPTLKLLRLCWIGLDGAPWHSVFQCMATRMQLDHFEIDELSGGTDTPIVCFADVERQRPLAYGSELREVSDTSQDHQDTLDYIDPELDDGYVWVCGARKFGTGMYLDRLTELDDVGYWLAVIRDRHEMI